MKNIHTLAILGGVAALIYYTRKGKSDAARQNAVFPTDPAEAAKQLEGYFSVGSYTGPAIGPYGRGHVHKSPCCAPCAHGLPCAG
jgi:hypothetical protein